MKKLFAIIVALFAFSIGIFSGTVFAQQSPDDTAKKYNITFPIAELGNCTDYSSCRAYCEDPLNATACTDFAKKKGFYKDESTHKSDLLEKAKTSLGCDSESSCREICSKEENFDKCNNFAKENNLSGGHTEDTTKADLIQKAKTTLGCSSESECRQVCSKEENRAKCSEFARENGLKGGEHKSGPGGCTSQDSCKAFCSDPANYQICQGYASSQGGNFQGPGGCNSEDSCRQYCQSNPDSCKNFARDHGFNPEEMCRKTPNCSWGNNTCNCGAGPSGGPQITGTGNYEKYCRENPERCKYNTSPYPTGGYSNDPAKACAQYAGCTWANNTCNCSGNTGGYVQPTSGQGSDPKTECVKYGCNWNGTSCDCSNKTSSTSPESECTKQSGCSWTGSSCNCSSTQTQTQTQTQQTYDPATECGKTAGCSWTGSTCSCSGVQGVATKEESLLQKILHIIFRN